MCRPYRRLVWKSWNHSFHIEGIYSIKEYLLKMSRYTLSELGHLRDFYSNIVNWMWGLRSNKSLILVRNIEVGSYAYLYLFAVATPQGGFGPPHPQKKPFPNLPPLLKIISNVLQLSQIGQFQHKKNPLKKFLSTLAPQNFDAGTVTFIWPLTPDDLQFLNRNLLRCSSSLI